MVRGEPLAIALPKGRLFDRVVQVLEGIGFTFDLGDRRLVADSADGSVRAMMVKNSDLPTYVHHGIASLGVCGTDVVYESGNRFYELAELPFGGTRICLASPRDVAADPTQADTITVATKYPRFARDWFHARGLPVTIIKLNGSVELAPVLGLAPYIVDLVETGNTLRAHDLEVRQELGRTRVVVVANPAAYKRSFRTIDRFVARLVEALHAQ